jgi:outer membrane protein
MCFKIFTFCAAVFVCAASATENIQWSLKQCTDHALEHNIRIKGRHLETTLYQNRYRQSKADLLPEVNGYANQDFRSGRSIDPFTNGYQEQNVNFSGFSLAGRITLFDGLRNINTIRRNEIDLAANEKDEEQLRNEITMSVVDAYLTALYNQEMIETAGRQLEVTRLQIDRTRMLVDAGSVSRGNLYELSALAAQEEVEQLKARNQKSISVLTLKQLLELDTLDNFTIAPPQLPEIHDTDLQAVLPDLYRSALSQPEVKRGELAIRSASLDLKIEKNKRLPTLSFYASIGTDYSDAYKKYRQISGGNIEEVDYPFSDQIEDNANTTLSLQLTVPLFSRLQTTSAINNAKINVEKKKIEFETIKKQVLLNVQTAYNDARAALHEYHGNIRAFEATGESFRYTEEKFNVDMVSSVDYHNGKNLLSKAESDVLQSKYTYFLKKSILEILCGKTVSID